MLSVIIAGDGDAACLANTLTSIVPAIPHGLIRDGWIIGHSRLAEIETIADLAGCNFLHGAFSDCFPQALAGIDSEWLLLVRTGVVMEEGWWRDVGQFLEHARLAPDPKIMRAVFRHADPRFGLWPRLLENFATLSYLVPFWRASAGAFVAHASNVTAGGLNEMRFPPAGPGPTTVLRAHAISPGKK